MQSWRLLSVSVVGLVFGASVNAHDDANWIERNPSYLDGNGNHCCGPGDCRRLGKEYFRLDGDAIYYLPTMQKFRLNGPGVHQSQTDDWWACIPGGNGAPDWVQAPSAICIFIPFHTH